MNTNVTDPLKPTHQTTTFILFALSAFIGPFVVLGLLVLANRFLPADDAQAFKAPLLAAWGAVTGGSGIGVVVTSVLKTWLKGTTQSQIAVNAASGSLPTGPAADDAPQGDGE